MKRRLEFIIIGAMKAGTTSLFEHLRRHPDLSLPPSKEDPYFSDDTAVARGWDAYIRTTFFGADPTLKWGTATPQYMVGGVLETSVATQLSEAHDERTVPRRIHDCLPDVRLIAILRDPVERARSHHRMAVLNRIDGRPFGTAVDELLRDDALLDARQHPRSTTGYVTCGEYGRILSGYFDVFPREQILVLFTDDLERDPVRLLQRIYAFLEVRSDFVPDDLGTRYRVGGNEPRLKWLGAGSALHPATVAHSLAHNRAAKRAWRLLPDTAHVRLRRRLSSTMYSLDLWNSRERDETADADAAALARLRRHYAADGDKLADLLGVAIPWQDRGR